MIKLGSNVVGLKRGSSAINRAYLGSTLVLGVPFVFTEHSRTTTTTGSITIPSDVETDDFALLVAFGANPQPAAATPVGWTSLQSFASAVGVGHRVTVYGKKIASGDAGASVSVFNSGSDGAILFIFRHVKYIPPGKLFIPSSPLSEETTANPAAQTIIAAGSYGLNVGIKYTYNGTSAFSTDPFDDKHIVSGGLGSLLVGYKYVGASAVNSTFDSNDNGDLQLQLSLHISFNAAL